MPDTVKFPLSASILADHPHTDAEKGWLEVWTASTSHLLSGPGSGHVATWGTGIKAGMAGNLQHWNKTQKSKPSRRSWF